MGIDEKHGVVADDLVATGARFGEALGAAAPFVGKGSGPDEGIRSAEERVDVLRLAGGRIVHFAGNRGIVLDRLGEGKATMSARIEQEASEASAGGFPESGCGERKRFAETETGTLGSDTGAGGNADGGDTTRVGEGSEETDGTLGGATGAMVGGESGARGG